MKLNQVTEGIFCLKGKSSTRFPMPASYLLRGREAAAIIETGPGASVPDVLKAIRELGWARDEIKWLIPTHIHMDHAGGAGLLIKDLPEARVVVYEKAARHLIDPAKLTEGTRQAFGVNFEAEFGPILPVPEQRLLKINDGARVDLGERKLTLHYAPGHANHHIAIFDGLTGALFCGESLGEYLPEVNLMKPTVALPMFDVEAALETVEKLRRLNPALFLFVHEVVKDDTDRIFRLAKEAILAYSEVVQAALREGLDETEIAGKLADFERKRIGRPFSEYIIYEQHQMAIGLSAYFRKKGPAGR